MIAFLSLELATSINKYFPFSILRIIYCYHHHHHHVVVVVVVVVVVTCREKFSIEYEFLLAAERSNAKDRTNILTIRRYCLCIPVRGLREIRVVLVRSQVVKTRHLDRPTRRILEARLEYVRTTRTDGEWT